MFMGLMSQGGDIMHFGLSYHEVLDLPLSLRDDMVEQLNEWRDKESAAASKARGG